MFHEVANEGSFLAKSLEQLDQKFQEIHLVDGLEVLNTADSPMPACRTTSALKGAGFERLELRELKLPWLWRGLSTGSQPQQSSSRRRTRRAAA